MVITSNMILVIEFLICSLQENEMTANKLYMLLLGSKFSGNKRFCHIELLDKRG